MNYTAIFNFLIENHKEASAKGAAGQLKKPKPKKKKTYTELEEEIKILRAKIMEKPEHCHMWADHINHMIRPHPLISGNRQSWTKSRKNRGNIETTGQCRTKPDESKCKMEHDSQATSNELL